VPLFHTIRTRPVAFSSGVQSMSQYMPHLMEGFRLLCTENLQAQLTITTSVTRSIDCNRFPRRGPRAIEAFNVLDAVYGPSSVEGVGDICARIAFNLNCRHRLAAVLWVAMLMVPTCGSFARYSALTLLQVTLLGPAPLLVTG
jgi:hypothetical protein